MKQFMNRFALIVAIITFIMCIASGISIFTSLIRMAIVFVGILFTFYLSGILLRLGIYITTVKPEVKKNK